MTKALTEEPRMDKAPYRWKITKDHIGTEAAGVEGPRNADRDEKSNPSRFSLYDADGECYYEGMIYGVYSGFEPLDDFGTPNAGAVNVKLNGEWL